MTKYRPRMPVTRVIDPKMRRMARRNLRGVGMNGMGKISTARVVVRLNDSVVMAWLRYDEHCAVITSVIATSGEESYTYGHSMRDCSSLELVDTRKPSVPGLPNMRTSNMRIPTRENVSPVF